MQLPYESKREQFKILIERFKKELVLIKCKNNTSNFKVESIKKKPGDADLTRKKLSFPTN